MKKVIFFSHNTNKINEITELFKGSNINVLSLKNFININEPEETGSSFKENSKIKSEYGFKHLRLPCFADDSGICISALGNLPGIKSKRYLMESGGFNKTFAKIINKTKKLSDSHAYFQTTIALTIDNNKTIFFNGIIKGNISSEPKGGGGFHYDPIFIPKGYTRTFAEMSSEEKNKISHRAIATKKLKKYLLELFN